MKNLLTLNVTPFSNDEVMKLIKLYQFKGKDFFYKDLMKSDMDSIIRQTVETECYNLAKYLNLSLTDNRKNLVIKKDSNPKNNEERLISNAKIVFSKIHADPHQFELITNEVLFLAKQLYKGIKDIAFNTYKVEVTQNLLREKRLHSTRNELDELLKKYESLSSSGNYEITYVIVNFYIDFINMNIFNFGNDIIGIMLLYILLFRADFNVFKYVSFMELLNLHSAEFKENVLKANYNYEEGYSKTAPLQKLIIDIMLEGYNKVETTVHEYTFDSSLNKSDNIENTIYKLPQVFTKDDIRELHPHTSESTINRTLQRLRDENIIRPNGVGRSATWIRLVDREVFNPDFKQIDIFDIEPDTSDTIGFDFNLKDIKNK